MSCLALNRLAVWRDKFTGHHAQASEPLREDIGLDIAIVVFARPDKSAGRFDGLCNHIIDQTVLVVDASLLKGCFVLATAEEVRQCHGCKYKLRTLRISLGIYP